MVHFWAFVSGYLGGPADLVLQRFVDTLLVLPGLVIAMTITVAFGFSVPVVIFALAVNNVGGHRSSCPFTCSFLEGDAVCGCGTGGRGF